MANGTLATRQAEPENRALALVRQAGDRLAAVLPSYYTPERLAQVLSSLAIRSPKILECERETLIVSLIQASALDLDISHGMNEAHLVPRWNGKGRYLECQFQPGYKGLEKLAVRTGAVRYIQPGEVYEADQFEVWREDGRTRFRHRIETRGPRGHVVGYYAVATMADGNPMIEWMTATEVEEVHQRTEGYRSAQKDGKTEFGPWVTDYNAMARKTVIRRLCKSLPRTSADPGKAAAFEALNTAIEHDNAQYEDWRDAREALPPPQNDSGYGRGQYASPEQTAEYLKAMEGFVEAQNQRWLDRWQQGDGAWPAGFEKKTTRELCNRHQADGHLLKWCVETGRLDPAIVPEEAKMRQLGRYTGIVYHRSKDDRRALAKELERYLVELWERKTEAVWRDNPELRAAAPGEDCDPDDADYPADDLADEPGSDG